MAIHIIDRKFDKTPQEIAYEQEVAFENELLGRDGRTGRKLKDLDGNDAYSEAEGNARLAAYRQTMQSERRRALDARRYFDVATGRRWKPTTDANGSANGGGFEAVAAENYGRLSADARDARNAAYELAKSEDRFNELKASGAIRKRTTFEDWQKTVRANADREFDKRVGYLLRNSAESSELMTKNRNIAYNIYIGGDYEKRGTDLRYEGAADSVKEFDEYWNGLSDAEKLTFDRKAAQKEYDDWVVDPEPQAEP